MLPLLERLRKLQLMAGRQVKREDELAYQQHRVDHLDVRELCAELQDQVGLATDTPGVELPSC